LQKKKNGKCYEILRNDGIDAEEAAKLGESISKCMNLTSLILDI
jgi:hypothetical protein